MSLDVYLRMPGTATARGKGSGIFVREDGATRELTREEWDEKFPGLEPVVLSVPAEQESDEVFSRNITHNLNGMAGHAGIYGYLWRPDELGITKASQLITPLTTGLELLKGLVSFVEAYLNACVEYPDADVSVSR